jgi:aquaporin related protein
MESTVVSPHQRVSTESRQELLRLPIQPHPAHFDFHMDPAESPVVPMHQNNALGLTSKPPSMRRMGGQPDPNDWNTPSRPRRQSNASHQVPYSPAPPRGPYIEEYSEEDEDPRQYRRSTRRHQRPPISYNNYVDQNSRYGPLPRNSSDNTSAHPAYADTPGKPNYEMYYPEDEYRSRRPGMPGVSGSRGPPRQPPPESIMRLPWAMWMGSNAKNRMSPSPPSALTTFITGD